MKKKIKDLNVGENKNMKLKLLKSVRKRMAKHKIYFNKHKKKFIKEIEKDVIKEIKKAASNGRNYCHYYLRRSIPLFFRDENIHSDTEKKLFFKELRDFFENRGFIYGIHDDVAEYISINWEYLDVE